jgi:fatty acid desaturase
VGQLCPECLRGRRAPNYQVSAATLAKGGITALVISSLAAALLSLVGGFWFLLFFIGPAIGELIVRGVDWATRNKRGRPMQITVAIAMVLSAAIVFFLGYGNPLTLLIYLLLGISTVVARLR